MEVIALRDLQHNLGKKLKTVLNGVPLKIKSKQGNFIIISEKTYKQLIKGKQQSSNAFAPKIPGKIIGSLEEADRELLDYLELPE